MRVRSNIRCPAKGENQGRENQEGRTRQPASCGNLGKLRRAIHAVSRLRCQPGVDWVVLTNGVTWRIYKVTFAKPIDQELVVECDFCALSGKVPKDVECLFLLCKEGWIKSVLGDYHSQKLALSRFFLGAMILSDPVLEVVRKELRRMSPDVRITVDEIRAVMESEVIKREVLEGDKANEARKKVTRSTTKRPRVVKEDKGDDLGESPVQPADVMEPDMPTTTDD